MQILKRIPLRNKFLLLFSLIFNFTQYTAARALSSGKTHFCLATKFDWLVPFLPWTIIIYWGCYVFWAINYCLCVSDINRQDTEFMLAHFIGESVCLLTFIFFPTTMERAMLTEKDFFVDLVKIQYSVDSADNLLPSIHCFASWLCWIGVRNNGQIPKWYRHFSLVIAISVCISTLTVKQHVIADVFAGIILAEASYAVACLITTAKGGIVK